MQGLESLLAPGSVQVHTTQHQGHSPEALSEMALGKIVRISGELPTGIREQIVAFQDRLKNILVFYMRQAALSQRTTIIARLEAEGHHLAAEAVRKGDL